MGKNISMSQSASVRSMAVDLGSMKRDLPKDVEELHAERLYSDMKRQLKRLVQGRSKRK